MIDWEDIATRHGPLVWRTVYRLLGTGNGGSADAARECFQDTFLTALDYATRRDVRNWPGLLQRIATTRALDAIASRRVERRRFTGSADVDLEHVASTRAGPGAAAEHAETEDRFRAALAELPPGQREAFCLRHFSQMSYEEIAIETGLSVDAVGVALHRARGRLKEALAPTALAVEAAAEQRV